MKKSTIKFTRSALNPKKNSDRAYYFCFLGDKILIKNTSKKMIFPLLTEKEAQLFGFQESCFIGLLNDEPAYSVTTVNKISSRDHHWSSLRDLYLDKDFELSAIAGYARQIFDWNKNFHFCGRCASETVILPNEHARFCEKCHLVNYPRISPAIIIAIIKDNQILLASGLKFPDKRMFSVLAGFLEPGESLEDCVKREVFEEVAIKINNIKYFKSQSWPFPDSLMIGFTADYQSGEIKVDKKEIKEAGWFKADALPKVPSRRSISSELIQWFLDNKA